MKRETNPVVALRSNDFHVLYAIENMAKAAGVSMQAWHFEKQGNLSAEEHQEYERLMVEFDKAYRTAERTHTDELATLRQQVATLTAERDAALAVLKPFAEAYANLPEGQRSVLFDFERNKFMINDMFPDGSTQRCLTTYHLEEAYKLLNAEATPPRLDSEGARLPFALADDGEVTE